MASLVAPPAAFPAAFPAAEEVMMADKASPQEASPVLLELASRVVANLA